MLRARRRSARRRMLKAQSLRTRSCSAGVRAAAAFKERLEMNDLTEPEDRSYKDWISTIESDNQTVEEYHKKLGRVDEFWRDVVFGIPELNQT